MATPPSSLVYGLYKPAQRPAHWMLVPHRHAHHKTGLDRKMKMEIIACSGADRKKKKTWDFGSLSRIKNTKVNTSQDVFSSLRHCLSGYELKEHRKNAQLP